MGVVSDARTPADEAPIFPSAPPERLELPGGEVLLRNRAERAARAAEAINASLQHLRPWMAWAQEPVTEAALRERFVESGAAWDDRRDFPYLIVDEASGEVLGGCGLHGRLGRQGLEIGYWVHADHVGRGLATVASRALTDAAFTVPGVERVRIRCEEANVASARVPAKLGYSFVALEVPDDGPCSGRSTQTWMVERADWMARGDRAPS